MIELVLLAISFVAGLLTRTMWAAWLGVGFGAWVALTTEVEAPAGLLGLAYGAITVAGISGGVILGRRIWPRRDRDHLAE